MQGEPAGVVAEEEALSSHARAAKPRSRCCVLIEGLSVELFQRQTGYDPRVLFASPIERLAAAARGGDADGGSPDATRLLLANRVMAEFLPAQPTGGRR